MTGKQTSRAADELQYLKEQVYKPRPYKIKCICFKPYDMCYCGCPKCYEGCK